MLKYLAMMTLIVACNDSGFNAATSTKKNPKDQTATGLPSTGDTQFATPGNGDLETPNGPGGDITGQSGNCNIGAANGIIDFESIPKGSATTDRQSISDQFKESHGITFKLASGGTPQIAKVGGERTAFNCSDCPGGSADGVKDTTLVGASFLTDGSETSASGSALIVEYVRPVTEASGVILDIDSGESWTITARDQAGKTIQTITFAEGQAGTGSGIATPWSVSVASPLQIHSLQLAGKEDGKVAIQGLGFDRFSPSKICK